MLLICLNSITATRRGLIPRLLAKLRGQKVDPTESGSSSESTGSKKLLFKVVLVAVAAVLFHYFSNSSWELTLLHREFWASLNCGATALECIPSVAYVLCLPVNLLASRRCFTILDSWKQLAVPWSHQVHFSPGAQIHTCSWFNHLIQQHLYLSFILGLNLLPVGLVFDTSTTPVQFQWGVT
jgi:phosphatidylinositol glycan class T